MKRTNTTLFLLGIVLGVSLVIAADWVHSQVLRIDRIEQFLVQVTNGR